MVGGWTALQSMPRLEDPVIVNRNPQIITAFPGATADRVEALVSEPIEQALLEVPGIKFIQSNSRNGISLIVIELLDSINEPENKRVFSEIRDRLGDVNAQLPEGVQAPFFDDKRNAVAFTMITALTWPNDETNPRILTRVAEDLARRLRTIPGTELVRLYGAADEEISVEVDPIRLASLGLRMTEIVTALELADSKTPSGAVYTESADFTLEVAGELDSLDRIAETPVAQDANGRTVRLSDIAKIGRGERAPPNTIALIDGQRTVLVGARVRPDSLVSTWTERSQEKLQEFRQEVAGGIEVEAIFLQDEYITDRLRSLTENLLLGAGVIIIAILLTMGYRSALIVSFALPLTAALTLFVINISGGKLHQMSIFGMIIALGLLIDNAIVVTDEVRKHKRAGHGHVDAASRAIRHLALPLFSSTITTVLSFMPIALLSGGAGDFVGSIAISVIIAVLGSYAISLTVIASLAASGRTGTATKPGPFEWLRSGINGRPIAGLARRILRFFAKHPLVAIGANLIVPIAGFTLAGTLGNQFFPRTDRDMFEIDLWLPQGTSIAQTQRYTREVEAFLQADPAVNRVSWTIGSSYPTVYYNLIMNQDGSPHYAHATVWTDDPDATDRIVRKTQAWADEHHRAVQLVARKFAQGPPADSDVEFRIYGPDIMTLRELGDQVRVVLAEHPEILHTQTTIPPGEPKIWATLDDEQLGLANLSPVGAANQLESQLRGFTAGVVIEGVEDIPIRVRRPNADRNSVANASDFVFTPTNAQPNEWIPLEALGKLELLPSVAGIERRNQQRMNKVLGFAQTGALPIDITNNVLAELDERGFQLPPGYRIELGGESENQGNAVGNLAKFLPVLVVAMMGVLILSFRSVRHAGILIIGAPLAVGYGLFATWLLGFPLSFNTIIGSMGLMGLAFNDNIVVLAAITAKARKDGIDIDSIVHETLDCGRHLISTTLTTIGSFMPLLLIIGGEFWPPLAIVLVGGVGGATLIAFTLTPSLYSLLFVSRKNKTNGQTA